jgi:hypothetical protein
MEAYYRHTTPEMGGRIATAIEQRLTVVEVAEQVLRPTRTAQRRERSMATGHVFWQISGKRRSEREGRCVVPGGAEGI